MRTVLPFLLFATPAAAWEASREGPVCLLTHQTDEARVVVSHDLREALPYAIELTSNEGWRPGPVFAIRFDGPGRRTISTNRHEVAGNTLRVTDRGFGNVLDGIALNHLAIAVTGDTALVIPLAGAAPEVEEFKACSANLGV